MLLPTCEPGQVARPSIQICHTDRACMRSHTDHACMRSHDLTTLWYRHHYQGLQTKDGLLQATEYRQMAGRAGRAGIDTQGEAILMANNPQLGEQLMQLMQVKFCNTT